VQTEVLAPLDHEEQQIVIRLLAKLADRHEDTAG
jgi:hypothetical protein